MVTFLIASSEANQEFLWHAFKILEWFLEVSPYILILCTFVVKKWSYMYMFGFSGQ